MSSVKTQIVCPNPKCCSNVATQELDSLGYTKVFCSRCGYSHEVGHISGQKLFSGGFGSYRITYPNGGHLLGCLGQPFTREELKRVFRRFMRSLNIRRLELTLNLDGRWKTVVLKDFPLKLKKFKAHGELFSLVNEPELRICLDDDPPF